MATITLPRGCKPSEACATNAAARAQYLHAWLRRRGDDFWLLATDTYVAAAVKVAVKGEVREGIVPIQALQEVERGAVAEQVSPTAWRIAGNGYTEITYDVGDRIDQAKLPDFDKVAGGALFTEAKFTAKMKAQPFGLDPTLMARVGQALGGPLVVSMTEPLLAIRVRSTYGADRLGLVMPRRVTDEKTKPRARPRQRVAA